MLGTRITLTLGILFGVCHSLSASDSTEGYFQASDGLMIHYIEAGRDTATAAPVVLIHGYTGTARGNWFSNGVAEMVTIGSTMVGRRVIGRVIPQRLGRRRPVRDARVQNLNLFVERF